MFIFALVGWLFWQVRIITSFALKDLPVIAGKHSIRCKIIVVYLMLTAYHFLIMIVTTVVITKAFGRNCTELPKMVGCLTNVCKRGFMSCLCFYEITMNL